METQQVVTQTLRIRQIRTAVTTKSPFYASLFLGLIFIPDPRVKTALVDGIRLWYNPGFIDSLDFDEACGVLAHEAFHCGAAHMCRIGDRELELYNRAADYVTNIEILKDFKLPKRALIDYRFLGMSVERVYNILDAERQQQKSQNQQGQNGKKDQQGSGQGGQQQPQGQQNGNQQPQPQQGQPGQGQPVPGQQSQQGQGQGQGQGQPGQGQADDDGHDGSSQMDVGGCGGFVKPRDEQGKVLPKPQQDQLHYEWEVKVTHANMVANRIGKAPGGAVTIIKELNNPKGDWRELLREWMQAVAADDYSWFRPDRRLITPSRRGKKGLYIPALHSETIGGMVVATDTSISMTDRMLGIIAPEWNAVLDQVRPEFVDALFCDTTIRREKRYEPEDFPVDMNFPGRGGTCVQPVFDWIEEQDYRPACLVYFTDLDVNDFPDEEPDYPVLWCSTKYDTAPFGEVIMLDEL